MIKTWWNNIVRRSPDARALILMYHRIDTLPCDPWQLAVNPDHFEQQLAELCADWVPVSLAKLRQNIADRTITDRSVVLTFDDGYIDNFRLAKPLLEKYGVPATFFITTQHCQTQQPFWWDELQHLLIDTPQLPEQLRLQIGSENLLINLDGDATLTPVLRQQHQSWIACENSPTMRCQAYEQLWHRLKPMSTVDQQIIMTQLREWAGCEPEKTAKPVCMTTDQLRQLDANPLFTIGSHTMNHPALAERPAEEQRIEIRGGNAFLSEVIGHPIDLFAYPYGNFNETSVSITSAEKLVAAVTTASGNVTRHSHQLRLNRYPIGNWDKQTFKNKLENWYSYI